MEERNISTAASNCSIDISASPSIQKRGKWGEKEEKRRKGEKEKRRENKDKENKEKE